MPASYAHYRFGKLLLPQLPPDVRQCIQRFRRMYDMGLQGPDFFLYTPIKTSAADNPGRVFHRQSGQEFFTAASKAADSEAARAYLWGLLGHYCLDAACHPFINRLAEIGEAEHIPLEAEFDRYLLVRDGESMPHRFDISRFLRPTRGECESMSGFYPGTTGTQVNFHVRCMARFLQCLSRPDSHLLKKLLLGIAPGLGIFAIPEAESEALVPYVRELQELYGQALERYHELLQQLSAHLQNGEALGDDFSPTF